MRHTARTTRRSLLLGLLTTLSLSVSSQIQAAVTDVQINALISQAIETHPLVASARAEQLATTEGINAAKLNLLPAPSVSMGYDDDDEWVSQVQVRQPLWTGGRLTANVNQAVFDDKAAVEYVYVQQNEVAKITIDAWQSYITAVAKQRVTANSLERLGEFEEMMQRRVAQGVSAPVELDLVTNRILQEQNAYQAAAEQQRIAAARLEQIIGEPLSQASALSVPDLDLLVNQIQRQSIPFEKMAFNQASFYNPTVVREAYLVESAKQELKAQQSALYPSVYAQYVHSYYEDEDENDGRFSIGLDYAPGAGFSNLALSRATSARVQSLRNSQEASRRKVMEEIQVKYQQFASAKDRELSLVAAVAGAQIVVNSYRRQFIAGRKTWNDVLNAVRELNDYQTQLAQTRAEILGSFYRLQVDFGLMSWQTFIQDRRPVELFNLYDSVQDWIEQGQQNNQTYSNSSVTSVSNTADNLIEPSQLSFSDASDLDLYRQNHEINYDAIQNDYDINQSRINHPQDGTFEQMQYADNQNTSVPQVQPSTQPSSINLPPADPASINKSISTDYGLLVPDMPQPITDDVDLEDSTDNNRIADPFISTDIELSNDDLITPFTQVNDELNIELSTTKRGDEIQAVDSVMNVESKTED